jgi:hypothetical protein
VLVLVDAGPRALELPAAAAPRRAAWFDPATGATTEAGRCAAGAPLALTAPPGGPWLLIVEGTMSMSTAPGDAGSQ